MLANQFLLKSGSFSLPQRLGDRSTVLLDYISRGGLPGCGERQFWLVTLARGWEEIYISKGQRKNVQVQAFKVNALRKGSSGAYNLEETG